MYLPYLMYQIRFFPGTTQYINIFTEWLHFTLEVQLNEYSSSRGSPNCISLYGVASLHKIYGTLASNGDATCICVS